VIYQCDLNVEHSLGTVYYWSLSRTNNVIAQFSSNVSVRSICAIIWYNTM